MELSSSPPPLAPPTTEEDKLSWLRLLRSRRVGPATFLRLMRQHGAATDALAALPEVAAQAGDTSYRPCPEGVVRAELRAARRAGMRPLFLGAKDYPPYLATLDDPPPFLWALGDPALAHRPAVAVIGARNASSLGLRMAAKLSGDLGAEGCVVVSGLARGIDAKAHAAALQTGTIAVLAGGVDVVYPKENAQLTAQIAQSGLLLSECAPGTQPRARDFPRRNRLISGLSAGVVVVEAALRSGTLGTARIALDQGREVMAVPGHPMDPRSAGANLLIRDGAHLVRSADDILEALDGALQAQPDLFTEAASGLRLVPSEASDAPPAPQPPAPQPDGLSAAIMNRLGAAPVALDQLVRDLAVPPGLLDMTLTHLELDGRIERGPGGLIQKST